MVRKVCRIAHTNTTHLDGDLYIHTICYPLASITNIFISILIFNIYYKPLLFLKINIVFIQKLMQYFCVSNHCNSSL